MIQIPFRDGTGPSSSGPLTGRGRGDCSTVSMGRAASLPGDRAGKIGREYLATIAAYALIIVGSLAVEWLQKKRRN